MEKVKTVLRKWGNSYGLVVPKNIVDNAQLNEGSEIVITIEPIYNTKAREVFGILKGKVKKSGKSTKEILKEIDKELWPEEE